MDILELVMLTLELTIVLAKKKHKPEYDIASDESIENLLYYKDCKGPTTKGPVSLLRATERPPPQSDCPCPRMCCSMCCECEKTSPFIGRQMAPLQSQAPMSPMSFSGPKMQLPHPIQRSHANPFTPFQPPMSPLREMRKKKQKNHHQLGKNPVNDPMLQPPIGARRDFGFTRENLKNLISKDQDIKKILKDLVRVTMHKVDLVEQVKARRSMSQVTHPTTEQPHTDSEEYMD